MSAHFRAYIQALEKLQLDIAAATDLIGVETRSTGFLLRGREPLKYRSAVFALGERINILKVLCNIVNLANFPFLHQIIYKSSAYEILEILADTNELVFGKYLKLVYQSSVSLLSLCVFIIM